MFRYENGFSVSVSLPVVVVVVVKGSGSVRAKWSSKSFGKGRRVVWLFVFALGWF